MKPDGQNAFGRAVSPKPPPDTHPIHGGLGETALPLSSASSDNGAFGVPSVSDNPPPALPARRKLPHEIPPWVKDGAIYFITINCAKRGPNQLAHPAIADVIEQSLLHRQAAHQWWIHLLLLMPDHAHGLVSFGPESSMRRIISDWKRYLARQHGIEWQRDFFDHRIRDDASLTEKWHYIRNNPVRKNLVSTPDAWPYQWHNGEARSSGGARSPSGPSSALANLGGFGETALPK